MSIERLKQMKEIFMCAVESQMHNLAEVDAEELGEVVDMIKDLEEAMYYCTVIKAMEGSENERHPNAEGMMYYTPYYGGNMHYSEGHMTDGRDMPRRYYG